MERWRQQPRVVAVGLAPLVTNTGKRRRDPLALHRALQRTKTIHGSSVTALTALCEDSKVDHQVTMSTVHLFKQKSTAVCNKATQLAVNWDLATYSGYQVNVGIVYSPDLETATVLLPKA